MTKGAADLSVEKTMAAIEVNVMTWWCKLFHEDWWYLVRADSEVCRIVCSKCKAPLIIYKQPAAMRAIAERLED
jgi:hypothetical protein